MGSARFAETGSSPIPDHYLPSIAPSARHPNKCAIA